MSLLDINFNGFSLAKLHVLLLGKLYQQRISRLYVVVKKIYSFPEKSELPKSILPVKISWLVFFSVSGVKMKNLERLEQAHSVGLVPLAASPVDFPLAT